MIKTYMLPSHTHCTTKIMPGLYDRECKYIKDVVAKTKPCAHHRQLDIQGDRELPHCVYTVYWMFIVLNYYNVYSIKEVLYTILHL